MSKASANITRAVGLGCILFSAYVAREGALSSIPEVTRTSLVVAPLWFACALLAFILAALTERR